MKALLSGLGLILFAAIAVPLVLLPHWLVALVVYLVLAMWLNALDKATGRFVGTGLAAGADLTYRWLRGKPWGRHLPFVRLRPVPIPPSNTYDYRVPGSDHVITVEVPPSAVYDYFDSGAVNPHQYIGKADTPTLRHSQHVADGRPFTNLPRDVQWFPCKCVALEVEEAAIRELRPVANIMHNRGPLETTPRGI